MKTSLKWVTEIRFAPLFYSNKLCQQALYNMSTYCINMNFNKFAPLFSKRMRSSATDIMNMWIEKSKENNSSTLFIGISHVYFDKLIRFS